MDCQEFSELISEAVDERLQNDAKRQFDHHAAVCLPCRNEYELDRLTKSVVRRNLARKEAPGELYYSVLAAIRQTHSWPRRALNTLFGEAFLNPAIALVALLIVVVGAVSLLRRDNAIPMSNDKNIIMQSLHHYGAAMTGGFKLSMVSHDPADVKDYLAKDTPFEVAVAPITGCDWCGGELSDFNGVKLAHVVYKIGGEGLLYVYQVNMDEAMHGKKLGLPENAKAMLARTGWYFEQTPNKCNIILWKRKNTLCVAVSMIEKEKMLTLLGEKAPS